MHITCAVCFQGVDTPSQRRYVHQLDALLSAQQAYLPGSSPSPSGRGEGVGGGDGVGSAEPTASGERDSSRGSPERQDPSSNGGGAADLPPGMIRPPASPTLGLTSLVLKGWYAKTPKGVGSQT